MIGSKIVKVADRFRQLGDFGIPEAVERGHEFLARLDGHHVPGDHVAAARAVSIGGSRREVELGRETDVVPRA